MTNHEFYTQYSSEANCIIFFKNYLGKSLTKCKDCNSKQIQWRPKERGWRCLKCTKRYSLKSISFMRDSNKNFVSWLEILHLILHSKKSIFIKEIMRRSRQTRYETTYYMVQKIRMELGKINTQDVNEFMHHFIFRNPKSKRFYNLPKYMNLHYAISKNRKADKINLVVPEFILNGIIAKKEEYSIQNNYSYQKLLDNCNECLLKSQSYNATLLKIDKRWQAHIRGNIIKLLKGIYNYTTGFHLQNVLNEYSFKYNYRNSGKSKLLIFLEKYIDTLGKKADI